MDQWLGDLFYRKVGPLEIESMYFHQLAYWDEWHKVLAKAEAPD